MIPPSARGRPPLWGPKMTPRFRAEIWEMRSIRGFDNSPRPMFQSPSTQNKQRGPQELPQGIVRFGSPFPYFVDMEPDMFVMVADYNTPNAAYFSEQ